MLGDRPRGFGAKGVTIIISLLAAFIFGSTAWQQFAVLPAAQRIVLTVLFAAAGAGIVWLLFLVFWLIARLVRRIQGK